MRRKTTQTRSKAAFGSFAAFLIKSNIKAWVFETSSGTKPSSTRSNPIWNRNFEVYSLGKALGTCNTSTYYTFWKLEYNLQCLQNSLVKINRLITLMKFVFEDYLQYHLHDYVDVKTWWECFCMGWTWEFKSLPLEPTSCRESSAPS